MESCPFCKSENTKLLSKGFQNQIPYRYRITKGNVTDESTFSLYIPEYLCLDCGMVFQKVSQQNLEEYKKWRPYFI